MKLTATLTISGSVQALIAVLQALPSVLNEETGPITISGGDSPNVTNVMNVTPSTSTGTGTPVAPASPPSVPNMAAPNPAAPNLPTMPMPTTSPDADEDEDESGGVSDGSGVDAEGLPWDERIHSSTKTKTAKGTWTKRRGGPKGEELAAIEAELRGGSPQPTAAPTMPVPAPAPMPQMAPPPAVAPAMPTPAPVAAAPAMPPAQPDPAPAPAPAPAAAGPLDFSGFMAKLTPLFQMRDEAGAPLVHADYLAQITGEISNAFQQAGHIQQPLTALTDIQNNQQMVEYAVALLRRDGKWVD